MLRYYLDRYNKDREKADPIALTKLMQIALKKAKVELPEIEATKVAIKFLVDLADFFYRNPDTYLSLGPFALYRCAPNNKNLLTMDSIKSNAKEIKDFYDMFGLDMEELKDLTSKFVEGLIQHSSEAEKKATEEIEKIKRATEGK